MQEENNYLVLTEDKMASLLEGCRQGARSSQKALYDHFCHYAFAICTRYSRQEAEATEVMNDGFVKVFMNINKFHHPDKISLIPAFKGWVKKIMVFTAIDQYRAQLKHAHHQDIEDHGELKYSEQTALDRISHKELITMVQSLSPAYRAVFNLFVIDGFSHEEIADKLGISIGTSKSNLSKARDNLRRMITKTHEEIYTRYE